MSRVKLTAGRIESFTCPDGRNQAFLWDDAALGLALRATANGAKAFIFQSRFDGTPIRMTIGKLDTWSIADARNEARRLQSLLDRGEDPRQAKAKSIERDTAERAAAKEAQLRRSVIGLDAWDDYVATKHDKWRETTRKDHADAVKAGGEPRTRSRVALTQPGPLRKLLCSPLAEIDADAIKEWLKCESAIRPTSTARNFRLLRGFLNWCGEHPEYHAITDAGAHKLKAVRAEVPKPGTKGDCLQREQLPAWFAAVRGLSNPVTAAYLQITLLTGGRREELADLQWDDIDFKWDSIRLSDKVEEARVIPLTPYMKALLEGLPRLQFEDGTSNPYVFSSVRAANGRIQHPNGALSRVVKAAGIPHLTIHGLRRSFGTLCEWVEMPEGISSQIQGHKPSATRERHYKRRPLDLLRMWHVKFENWILEQAGIDALQDNA